MARKPKFPKTLYVVREPDGDESYLAAFESVDDITENNIIVASYTLASVDKLVLTRQMEQL